MSVFRAGTHSYTSSVPAVRLSRALELKCGNNHVNCWNIDVYYLLSRSQQQCTWPWRMRRVRVCVGGWRLGEGAGCRAHNTITQPSVTAEETWASSTLLYCTPSYKCAHVGLTDVMAADRCLAFPYRPQQRADKRSKMQINLTIHCFTRKYFCQTWHHML